MTKSGKPAFQILLFVLPLICFFVTSNVYAEAEQGLEEIQPLFAITEIGESDGLSLEEMTDAVEENVMSEYYDSSTGFAMHYPSVFQFDESLPGSQAVTADGQATLFIEHMENNGALDEKTLLEAFSYEGTQPRKYEQNGCLRIDRAAEKNGYLQTDLYLLTEKFFHHITIIYPENEKGNYFSYIEYMINTMDTSETDLG